jgi:hypothetical protein
MGCLNKRPVGFPRAVFLSKIGVPDFPGNVLPTVPSLAEVENKLTGHCPLGHVTDGGS